MHDELKFLGLTPLFGICGAAATALAWQIFAFTMLDAVPAQLAVLSCMIAGLGGPAAVWFLVWIGTRRRNDRSYSAVRQSASVGLGLVFATEVGFYIPLGFFAIAFH
ncbi:MAG: hypothetical protein LJE93_14155 [Acidobacteria bacterium]|jgi:hypothetical protein|nr:hypothetical protein [Acidobacteriota bacterium]